MWIVCNNVELLTLVEWMPERFVFCGNMAIFCIFAQSIKVCIMYKLLFDSI